MKAAMIDSLKEILANSQAQSAELRIVVHEFGHTPLYVPFYMAMEDLRRACVDPVAGGKWLSIEYQAALYDSKALDNLEQSRHWVRGGPACLHLGLSEITDRFEWPVAGRLVERPFVKRLPLWGVALANNPRINAIKSRQRRSELVDFWRLFSGKLSLLDLHSGDLNSTPVHSGGELSLSIYGPGSTVYRQFTSHLTEVIGMDALDNDLFTEGKRLRYVTFENEFEPLLAGEVDFALTVQPWRALRKAIERHRELELVYTHLAKPTPVTSVYLRHDPDDHFGFWQAFVSALASMIHWKVERLYECGPKAIEEAYQSYHCSGGREHHENEEDFGYAMRLLSDSRVFVEMDGLELRQTQEDSQALVRARTLYFDIAAKRDTAYGISIMASLVHEVGFNWHDQIPMNDLEGAGVPELEAVIRFFEERANAWGVSFDRNEGLNSIRHQWCLRSPHAAIPQVLDAAEKINRAGVERPVEVPGHEAWKVRLGDNGQRDPASAETGLFKQVDFGPWAHRNALAQAFRHLNSQFQRADLIPRTIKADVLVLHAAPTARGELRAEGLSWLWIEYDRDNEARPVHPNNFMDGSDSRHAQALLNAWYVERQGALRIERIFEREGHGDFNVTADGSMVLEVTSEDRRTLITQRMQSNHGLLFTFRVAGLAPPHERPTL